MVQININEHDAVLTFPKQLLSTVYVQDFLERLRMESIVEKSQLSEEQAWELSEEVKEQWWASHQTEILQRIKR